MKHALITLIIVFIFVLLVVPLLYISLGKLKNPVDLFALNKVSNSAGVTQKTNFITPNYVPESGSLSKTIASSEGEKKLREDIDYCFSDSVQWISKDYISLKKSSNSRLNVKNNVTGITRYFEGFYPTIETEKSIKNAENSIISQIFVTKPGCAVNGTSPQNLHIAFNDTGEYMKRMGEKESDTYDFTNKGLTTINGLQYYWYQFENKDRIYANPGDELFYMVLYNTYFNGAYHTHQFFGSSRMFGTVRDFLNQTQVFLAGTVYGTSTFSYTDPVDPSTPVKP